MKRNRIDQDSRNLSQYLQSMANAIELQSRFRGKCARNPVGLQKLFTVGIICVVMLCLLIDSDEVFAAAGYEHVAKDAAGSKQISQYGMLPVYGTDVKDGTYEVALKSSSKYFRISSASLHVEQGQMQVTFTLDSHAYSYVFPGTAEEAAAAELASYIPCEESDGGSTVTMDVPALDAPFPCAAFSVKREKWYSRNLLIRADSLPAEALHVTLPDYDLIEDALEAYEESHPDEVTAALEAAAGQDVISDSETAGGTTGSAADAGGTNFGGGTASDDGTAGAPADGTGSTGEHVSEINESGVNQNGGSAGEEETSANDVSGVDEAVMQQLGESGAAAEIDLANGTYAVEVTMTGGSGRASVSSPTWLIVQDGYAFAKLLWSSTYYDYMIVGGRTFRNETTDGGNSTFIIPVEVFDEPMTVIADTTAMGDPVEIEYALTFYEDTVGSRGQIPQEAAKKVLVTALGIIVAGGILNAVVKRRRGA